MSRNALSHLSQLASRGEWTAWWCRVDPGLARAFWRGSWNSRTDRPWATWDRPCSLWPSGQIIHINQGIRATCLQPWTQVKVRKTSDAPKQEAPSSVLLAVLCITQRTVESITLAPFPSWTEVGRPPSACMSPAVLPAVPESVLLMWAFSLLKNWIIKKVKQVV